MHARHQERGSVVCSATISPFSYTQKTGSAKLPLQFPHVELKPHLVRPVRPSYNGYCQYFCTSFPSLNDKSPISVPRTLELIIGHVRELVAPKLVRVVLSSTGRFYELNIISSRSAFSASSL